MRAVLLTALLAAVALPAAAQSTVASAEAAASRVEGVVTDAETGDPVVGAGVMIPDLEIGAVSGRDGRFVLDGVPSGVHSVRVGAYTYHQAVFDVEVVEGEAAALDAPIRPGAAAGCAAHDHGEDDTDA